MSPDSIVITGASRGIGEALARVYAREGAALLLIGRDADRLGEVAAACRAAGASAATIVADVRDRSALRDALREFDALRPVDLVIANAGVALPAGDHAAIEAASYGEIEVNLVGALNTILPLVPAMAARGRGQIALVSSLAAFAPLPDSPGYSASKAALLVYGLALRERLRRDGIRVNVVCPGYVETEMGGRYAGWRPLLMPPDAAARRIAKGLAADRPVVAFPRRLAVVARMAMLVPERLRRLGLSGFRHEIGRGG